MMMIMMTWCMVGCGPRAEEDTFATGTSRSNTRWLTSSIWRWLWWWWWWGWFWWCLMMIFIVLLTWPVFDCSLRWPWEASERFPWEEEISRPAGPNTSTRLDKTKSRSQSWVPVELKKKHCKSAKLLWHHNIKLSFLSLSSFLFLFFLIFFFFSYFLSVF